MQKIWQMFVILIFLSLLVGGIATYLGKIDVGVYALFSGVAGSAASILGLLAFFSSGLSKRDFILAEQAMIGKLAEAGESLQAYEEKISQNKKEISDLERARLETEVLVRQLSIKFFLEERLSNLSESITRKIDEDLELRNMLESYFIDQEKIKALNIPDAKVSGNKYINELLTIIENEIRSRKESHNNLNGDWIAIFFVGLEKIAIRIINLLKI